LTDGEPTRVSFCAAAAVYPLRALVLRPGQPVESCAFPSDDSAETSHFVADRAGRTIGIASIYHVKSPRNPDLDAWQLRGMATHPEARGGGAGAALLAAAISHARAQGASLVWCNARTAAAGFYERFGFESYGDKFDIPDVGPHYYMELLLRE